jgi:DNA-binding MarR family transcriptional regulator
MPARPPAAGASDAAALFIALGGVVKRLRRNPLPDAANLGDTLQGAAPAPRHIVALLQVASDGPIGMTELAERLGVSLATASLVVTDLAEWGVVERTTDTTDRRRTFVAIAEPHRAMARALLDSRLKPLQRTLRRLEPREREGLVRGLQVLAEELDATRAETRPEAKVSAQ